jgi:hypothetical protein
MNHQWFHILVNNNITKGSHYFFRKKNFCWIQRNKMENQLSMKFGSVNFENKEFICITIIGFGNKKEIFKGIH